MPSAANRRDTQFQRKLKEHLPMPDLRPELKESPRSSKLSLSANMNE
jgi:hypothetical protein